MNITINGLAVSSADWLEGLLRENEEEVRYEARSPTLLMQSTGRRLMWNICALLGVNKKGVPGNACRLLESYLSRIIRTFLQVPRDIEEWERFKSNLADRFYLLMASCVMLAGKMRDLHAALAASTVSTAFLKEGVVLTRSEIVQTEFHVYSTLDFRLPLWTTLEICEFLASQIGIVGSIVIEALGLVINMTEFHRDQLDAHMTYWHASGVSVALPPGTKIVRSIHNLHLCAAAVAATANYMQVPIADPVMKVAILIQTNPHYIKAITDAIGHLVIPGKVPVPLLRKRRLVY